MENNPDNFFSNAKKEFEQYVQDRIWLFKLQVGEKSAFAASRIVLILFFGVLAFFFFFFLGILTGFYLSDLTNSYLKGFGMVTGFYLILMLILFLIRKSFQRKLVDFFISLFFANVQKETHVDQ